MAVFVQPGLPGGGGEGDGGGVDGDDFKFLKLDAAM
jgi:hypothetical protein